MWTCINGDDDDDDDGGDFDGGGFDGEDSRPKFSWPAKLCAFTVDRRA